MRAVQAFSAITMFLVSQSVLRAGGPEPAGDPISPEKHVIKIFDGRSLDNFYTWLRDTKYEDPRHVFQVVDDLLVISGDGLGAVVTKRSYRDYHLVLEYRWGKRSWPDRETKALDSGLLIHSNGADGGYQGIWMPSLEVQIIEGGVGDFIRVAGTDNDGRPVPMTMTCQVTPLTDAQVIWNPDGPRVTYDGAKSPACPRVNWLGRDPQWQDVRGFRGKQDPDSPGEAWTRLDVICDGDHVETFVNGVKVNEAFDVSPSAGRLQLQSELAEIQVRRWELWPLSDAPAPAAAESPRE